jgi:protein-disulfide isomerase
MAKRGRSSVRKRSFTSAPTSSRASQGVTGRQANGRSARRRRGNRRQTRQWLIWAAVAVGAVALLTYALWPRAQAQPLPASRLDDSPTLGPASAKVTIVEYGDFGCPSCKAWHQAGVLNQVVAKYGANVRFVWRDFPIVTTQSPKAAEAGQCAFDQGKFWQYHDLLYQKAPALAVDDLKTYARQLGLDSKTFDQCLDSGQNAPVVQHTLQDAYSHGFTGTPSFLINGKPQIGGPSFAYLSSQIDQILTAQ